MDSEKVIKELEERIKVAEECKGNLLFTPDAIRTIVAMLKEHEAVKPTWGRGKPFCGACCLQLRGGKFCSECGKPIAWEGR